MPRNSEHNETCTICGNPKSQEDLTPDCRYNLQPCTGNPLHCTCKYARNGGRTPALITMKNPSCPVHAQ